MARTRHVEAALARSHGGQRIRVVATDERLGKLVGAILHQAGLAVIGSLMRMWLLSARHLMPHWC
jgi:hypothetical protein